ncbi:MAG: PilZ domain-containing protein [Vicinamibacterales bacterium]
MGNEPLNTILVGSEELVAAWCAHAGRTGDVLTFSDADANAAYEAILKRRPRVVILDQMVASTSRGAALVDCVRSDTSLAHVEIRILSPESAAVLTSQHGQMPAGALVALAHPMQMRTTRRAVRVKMPRGVEAVVDGRPVQLIDLSIHGAQVLSWEVLKPNQRIRITLDAQAGLRYQAAVAWATFELPRPTDPRYRAGMEFRDADPARVQQFYSRLRVQQ